MSSALSPFLRLSSLRLAKTGPSKGRGPLLTKFAPKGFKKGYGAVGLGRHTKKGFFIINPLLVPMFKMPDLSNCKMKCYVSPRTYRIVQQSFCSRPPGSSLDDEEEEEQDLHAHAREKSYEGTGNRPRRRTKE